MIWIFNRKELIATFSMEEQARIRNLLHDNNIDYSVKSVNRSSASAFAAGSRSRTGSFGNRQMDMYEYVIYVRKEDYELAKSLTTI